jgi:PAS domain S-box-containing protein
MPIPGEGADLMLDAMTSTVLDSLAAEIAVLDASGVIIAVNASWRHFADENRCAGEGRECRNDIGTKYLSVCRQGQDDQPDGELGRILAGIRAVIDGRAASFSCTYPCHSPTQRRFFSLSVTPLARAGGGVVVSHTDISERILAEESLRRVKEELAFKEEQLTFAMKGSGVGIWDWSINTGAVVFSDTLLGMVGYVQGELPAHVSTWSTMIHPDDVERTMAELNRHLDGESPTYRAEFRCRHKLGHWIWVLASGEVITRDALGVPIRIIGTHVDITRLKEASSSLEAACKAAVAGAQAKSEFLATMSHEIRTPINGIMGMIEMLRRMPLGAEQDGYAKIAYNSAESLLSIINDVLDLSKLEANKLVFDTIPLDIHNLVHDIAELFLPQVSTRAIELLVRITPDVPRMVVGDPGRLRQVLMNLVGNAVKFTIKGHVLIEVLRSGSSLILKVSDTGIGIPMDQIGRLFAPFTQVDATNSRKFGGSGLGLAISRRLIECMDGTISVTSELGSGSVFTATLPLPTLKATVQTMPGTLDGLRILVVDDSSLSSSLCREQLESFGARPQSCPDASLAFTMVGDAMARGQAFAAVIYVARKRGEEGLHAASQIRNDPGCAALAQILLVDARARSDVTSEVDCPINGFLVRPVRANDLADLLVAAIDRCRSKAPGLLTRSDVAMAGVRKRYAEQQLKANILLVEDNEVNQILGSRILTKMGVTVTIANNGLEALDQIAKQRFDVVFMDCQMPELDGYGATERIRALEQREQGARIPIIAMTANVMPGSRERCLSVGMDDFISKPIKIEQFEEMVRRWVLATGGPIPSPARTQLPDQAGPTHVPPLFDPMPLREMDAIDPGMATAIMVAFRRDLALFLSEAEHILGQGDLPTLRAKAHKIKGSSGSIGAKELHRIAHDLEMAGHAADGKRCSESLTAFLHAGRAFLDAITVENLKQLLVPQPKEK